MKKVAVIMMLLMVSGFVFAQKYPYQNEEYRQAAVLVFQKQPVDRFPGDFFVELGNPEMTQEDINLYHEIKNAYENNEYDFNAIMNYAHALMISAPGDRGLEDEVCLNNQDLARKLLKRAQKIQPDNLRVYQDLNEVLYLQIFDQTDVLVYENLYDKCKIVEPNGVNYRALTKEWLVNFDKRISLKDQELLPVEFEVAAEMANAIGWTEKAEKYSAEAQHREKIKQNIAQKMLKKIIQAGSGNITGQVSFL